MELGPNKGHIGQFLDVIYFDTRGTYWVQPVPCKKDAHFLMNCPFAEYLCFARELNKYSWGKGKQCCDQYSYFAAVIQIRKEDRSRFFDALIDISAPA